MATYNLVDKYTGNFSVDAEALRNQPVTVQRYIDMTDIHGDGSNVTLTSGDILQLFALPVGAFIKSAFIIVGTANATDAGTIEVRGNDLITAAALSSAAGTCFPMLESVTTAEFRYVTTAGTIDFLATADCDGAKIWVIVELCSLSTATEGVRELRNN